jgi:hypothetical protein
VNGYTDYRQFASGRDACITRLGFNYAILANLTASGYGDRWRFQTYVAAWHALEAWNGTDETEPRGWHRTLPVGGVGQTLTRLKNTCTGKSGKSMNTDDRNTVNFPMLEDGQR